MTWAMLVPRKGTEFPWIAKRAAKFIDQRGHNRVTFRCDNEPANAACARETASGRKSVQRDHGACGGPRCRPGQCNEGRTGAPHRGQSPARRKDIALAGGVCGIPDEQVRHRQRRKDNAAKSTRATHGFWILEKGSCTCPPNQREEDSGSRGSTQECLTGDQYKVGEHQESTRVGEAGR